MHSAPDGQKSELVLRNVSEGPAERLSSALSRAHSREPPQPALAKKRVCSLVIYCDIKKEDPEDLIKRYHINPSLAPFILEQAKRNSRLPPGRRYILFYSNQNGKLAGPAGEVRAGETPSDAIRRIAKEKLVISDAELGGISNFRSFPGEEAELSVFCLCLPHERLQEMASAINDGIQRNKGMEDFVFSGLVKPEYFNDETMSEVYMGRFQRLIECLEQSNKPI